MSDLPRLLSFTLDGWPVLGGPVTISLNDGVAVLVGRNGAGKSAILEGLKHTSSFVIGKLNSFIINKDNIPNILTIEIFTPNSRLMRYKYESIKQTQPSDEINMSDFYSQDKEYLWNETCQYLDQDKEVLWTTKNGITSFQYKGKNHSIILGNTSSIQQLNIAAKENELPIEMKWVRFVLAGVNLLSQSPHPELQVLKRHPCLLSYPMESRELLPENWALPEWLTVKLNRMEREKFEEFQEVCRRIGLGTKLIKKKFIFKEEEDYVLEILLDGVNIGLLSNGTLRVLSILLELVTSSLQDILIIEEPETQIHPGMLAKLLNEIESYTYGKNLILSTHSPQVVSWTQPNKINLTYRENGRTFARKLATNEIENVVEYLNEEGDLGDWIYSGILDE